MRSSLARKLLFVVPLLAVVSAAPAQPAAPARVDPSRFGEKRPDPAFGAFQRGLYITALNIGLPRAKEGDPAAQTLVAEIYARGLGVPQNEKEAAKWYAAAAEQGVAEAQFQYALILMDGRLAEPDEARALDLLQQAAKSGNRLAQFNLAQLLVRREPGPKGFAKATEHYRAAADAGLADAQYAMAQIRMNGSDGQPPDDAKAREWLEKAARQNFDTAQVDLGTWLVEGRGGKRDMRAGYGWMHRAALGGNVAAQARLAKLHVQGLGVEPDRVEGAAWYIIARRAGLHDPYMEDVMLGLTDEEKKQAIDRANKLR